MAQAVTIPVQETKAPGQWSYEDYLALPDDGRRYEIIEGVLYVGNAPDAVSYTHLTLPTSDLV